MSNEIMETFDASEVLSNVTFKTTVDFGCPYREVGRDEYEVTIGYGLQALCVTGGASDELVESYEHARVSGEETAVKIGDRVSEALDPRHLRIDVELHNAPSSSQHAQSGPAAAGPAGSGKRGGNRVRHPHKEECVERLAPVRTKPERRSAGGKGTDPAVGDRPLDEHVRGADGTSSDLTLREQGPIPRT